MITKEQIEEIKNSKFQKTTTMPSKDLNQLYPTVKKLALKLIEECKKIGIPIIVTQTFRTHEYQHKLYMIGRTPETKNKAKVTNADSGSSMHEFRCAFDICINIKGKCYDTAMLDKVGKIGQKLGLTYGGDWDGDGSTKDEKFVDRPHFQFTFGYSEKDIRNGKTPIK